MSDFIEINLNEKKLPSSYRCGFLRFGKMDELPLDHITWHTTGKSHVTMSFWGLTSDPANDVALINIEMFKLPGAQEAFAKKRESWSHDRKKWVKLPEGVKFESPMLSLEGVPAHWSHDGFGTRGRSIVHIYTGPSHALIVRLLLYTGTLLNNPFLLHAVKNFRVDEHAWVVTPPVAKARKLPPAASDGPLSAATAREVDGSIKRAYACLQLKPGTKPEIVQQAIYDHVIKLAGSPKKLSSNKLENQAIELGCLWGQSLGVKTGWKWREVTYPSGEKLFALVSKDRSLITAPLHFMNDQLKRRGKNAEITTLLLFNMIVSSDSPGSRPKGYQMLR